MKELWDGSKVSSREYYYLLDWNEENKKDYIYRTFMQERICDLTLKEFKQLFLHAAQEDYKKL